MTGTKGNTEFCFPETLNVSFGLLSHGHLKINVKKKCEKENSPFPWEQSLRGRD